MKQRRKRWLFRLLSAVLVPLVILGVLELVLRIAGYGYPTGYFLETEQGGRDVLTENPKFSWRFFPRALARAPSITVLSKEKGPGTVRIFVFGESAAKGEPEPAFGFARMLRVLLEGRFPGKRFEVVNVAMTAINSHVIRAISRDCAALEGDFWVLYMGNNEVLGPFGANSVFGARPPGLGMLRARLAVETTRIGQLLGSLVGSAGAGKGTRESWGGMEMFLDQQVRADDPELEAIYQNFSRNLGDILRTGVSSGAKVIACTVATNLKDCAPFASQSSPSLAAAEKEAWAKRFDAGRKEEEAGRFAQAIEEYREAAKLDSSHAELSFRMGRCAWSLERYTEAREHFTRARDLDTIRLRADTRINRVIRETASGRTSEGIQLLDVEAFVNARSPHDTAGEEMLHEHVHFNFAGNYLVARLLAETIAGLIPDGSDTGGPAAWPDAEECARRLAYTPWERYRVAEQMRQRLRKPPYNSQLNHAARDGRLEREMKESEAATKAAGFERLAAAYEEALRGAPEDWMLHDLFGTFLASYGKDHRAAEEFRKLTALVPHHFMAWYKLGVLFNTPKTAAEAEKHFSEAVRLRPDFPEALNGLGVVLASQGKHEAACARFAAAVKVKPELAEAHFNWAKSLATLSQTDAAAARYEEAARLAPSNVPVQLALGKLLAEEGKHGDAAARYGRALELEPHNPIAHEGIAECLKAEGKLADARAHLLEALKLLPKSAKTHAALGHVLLDLGEAEPAARSFDAALRLDRSNASAARGLEKARSLQGEVRRTDRGTAPAPGSR
jgi:tetratricopeptide (TPR) repeat protein